MIVGIDASNLRAGGGLTHLVHLLAAADPRKHGFERVIVWGGRLTLARLADRPWLEKRTDSWLDRSLPWRVLWQRYRLPKYVGATGIDVLFAPGGTVLCSFEPIVTMSRNLLPFDATGLRRYAGHAQMIRVGLLRWTQIRSFARANGVIFLTQYAKNIVLQATGPIRGKTVVIPHGINAQFFVPPRTQTTQAPDTQQQIRLVYVSIVDVYKHQDHVAKAVAKLRAHGFPVTLDLIGPAYGPALRKLQRVLRRLDPQRSFIRYWGPVPYERLPQEYARADVGIFASSCENLPNILLEMMASGLPVACSNRGPMPAVLGDAGVYFDPENPESIADAIRALIVDRELARQKAWAAFERAQHYRWERTVEETFRFLAEVVSGPATSTIHSRSCAASSP